METQNIADSQNRKSETEQARADTATEIRARLARVRHEIELEGVLEKVTGIPAPIERARLLRKLERVKGELSEAVKAELAAVCRDYGLASENPGVRERAREQTREALQAIADRK